MLSSWAALLSGAWPTTVVRFSKRYSCNLLQLGEEGVSHVLQLLKDELKMAMQLAGYTKIGDLKPSIVRSALSFQSKL